MLHAKFESPYSLGQEDFQSFVFWLPWQPEFFTEFKSLKYPEGASPKDHFCKVSLKSAEFRGEDFSSDCSCMGGQTDGRRTLIDHNSSP